MLTFIGSFNLFALAYALGGSKGDPAGSIDVLGLVFYRTAFEGGLNAIGHSSALAVLMFIFIFGVAVAANRFLRAQGGGADMTAVATRPRSRPASGTVARPPPAEARRGRVGRGRTCCCAAYAVVAVGPLVFMLLQSFRPSAEIFNDPLGLPHELYLDNYTEAWREARFATYFTNSVLVVVAAVALCTRGLGDGRLPPGALRLPRRRRAHGVLHRRPDAADRARHRADLLPARLASAWSTPASG